MPMNIFKKVWQWFSKKDKPCEADVESHVQNSPVAEAKDEKSCSEKSDEGVRVLGEMPHCIVHPADLMEWMLMMIAYQTKDPAFCSIGDIKLYSLYNRENGAFQGSFYALEWEGLFYGNIVGSPQVFSCSAKAFRMEETDKLFAPLDGEDGKILVLMCEYNRQKKTLSAICLKKMDEFMHNEEILHKFDKGTSFNEAYSFYQNMIKGD